MSCVHPQSSCSVGYSRESDVGVDQFIWQKETSTGVAFGFTVRVKKWPVGHARAWERSEGDGFLVRLQLLLNEFPSAASSA